MTQKLNTLLSRLEKVKSNGSSKWLACCPAHPDKSPSLGIKLTDDDKILIKCFSGCSVVEIVTALGLELSDLMPESVDYKKGAKPPRFNKYELFEVMLHYSTILMIVQDTLASVVELRNFFNETDLKQIDQARNSIEAIAREVSL